MQVIIGVGIVTCVLVYSIVDAIRFLPRWSDKVMYVTSCLLLKPILLPVILGGYCFKSPLREYRGGHNFETDGLRENEFMLAV